MRKTETFAAFGSLQVFSGFPVCLLCLDKALIVLQHQESEVPLRLHEMPLQLHGRFARVHITCTLRQQCYIVAPCPLHSTNACSRSDIIEAGTSWRRQSRCWWLHAAQQIAVSTCRATARLNKTARSTSSETQDACSAQFTA